MGQVWGSIISIVKADMHSWYGVIFLINPVINVPNQERTSDCFIFIGYQCRILQNTGAKVLNCIMIFKNAWLQWNPCLSSEIEWKHHIGFHWNARIDDSCCRDIDTGIKKAKIYKKQLKNY